MWLKRQYLHRQHGLAERMRGRLAAAYGAERAAAIEFVEAFEISEYAQSPDAPARERLFPLST
jgi:hypothetical protein